MARRKFVLKGNTLMNEKLAVSGKSECTGSALPSKLREEHKYHQTVYNDDRRRKLLFLEAAQRIEALENAIADSLMHLNTNIDVDGNSMSESDAADCLNAVMQNDIVSGGAHKH